MILAWSADLWKSVFDPNLIHSVYCGFMVHDMQYPHANLQNHLHKNRKGEFKMNDYVVIIIILFRRRRISNAVNLLL